MADTGSSSDIVRKLGDERSVNTLSIGDASRLLWMNSLIYTNAVVGMKLWQLRPTSRMKHKQNQRQNSIERNKSSILLLPIILPQNTSR